MNLQKTLGAVALAALAAPALAAVSADEAKQLGNTLTEFGATKAGNADGSIPAYTGGVTTAPAGFKPGTGKWVDPFKDDKPLFRIDSKNWEKYADKLSDGQKHLLKNNPEYYLDIYPSRRSAAYPEKMLKATVRNATSCKTLRDGIAVDTACRGGLPFPIPKNGLEAMWNQILHYQGDTAITTSASRSWVVDTSGKPTMTSEQSTYTDPVWYQADLTDRDPNMAWRVFSVTKQPARLAGAATGLTDFIDPVATPRKAWSYTPGQRRVRQSPEFSYDTPVASQGGLTLFDELFIVSGKLDRFDYKLAGKKEMYIPYNEYKGSFECPTVEMALKPKYANPDCHRWELHRVWVVEATLKSGMRHAYSKRNYYLDEDMTGAGLYDAFDQNGQLYRSIFNGMVQLYDHKLPWAVRNVIFDFNKNMYGYFNDVNVGGHTIAAKAAPERELNPESIVTRETAR
ncbi:DUF1329 domain-containing protein [Azohydromonas lata]|uniref:DUF1329 domain-containing protein n=1 Tax=Azohydromonas lata TaxID=45677 RepID=UPI000836C222|nr:DUF1329 domain-containing protein [Azohydromonas lata]